MYYICYNSVGHLCCVVSSWLAPISFKVWGWKRLPEAALPSNSQQLPPRLPPLRACTRLHTRSQQQTRREEQPLLSWWSCLSSWAEEQPAAVSLSLSLCDGRCCCCDHGSQCRRRRLAAVEQWAANWPEQSCFLDFAVSEWGLKGGWGWSAVHQRRASSAAAFSTLSKDQVGKPTHP